MSINFKGTETNTLDSKSRVAFPARMRKELTPADKTFVINRGIDKCIDVYPEITWKVHQDEMMKLKQYREEERALIEIMYEMMYDVDMDSQSRILISKELLNYAGITDKVKIRGMIDHIQLWDPEIYEAHKQELAKKYTYASALQQVFDRSNHE